MNNNVEAHYHVGSYVNPLIISGAGIICSCLALATYHFILCRLCLRTHHPQLQLHQIADTSPTHSIDIPCGVDPEILNKIPILSFSPQKRDVFGLHQSECAICLGELERGEKLRLLPSCSHAFHIPCIDLWLSRHSNCPVCRAPIAIASPPSFSLPSRNVDDHEFEGLSRHVVPPLLDSSSSSDHSSASSSRSHVPRPLLQHSLSVAYASRETPEALAVGLKRSLSMDQSCDVASCIQIDQEKASTSSSSPSSSSAAAAACARNGVIQGKAISLRQLDHMSTMLMTSLTQLRNTRNEASQAILPN